MNVYEEIEKKLVPLGIYSFEDTNIKREIEVYAEELQSVYTALDLLLREAFIQSAEDFGLLEREKMYSKGSPELPVEKRREMLLKRLTLKDETHTADAIAEFISSLGIEFTITENPHQNIISVQVGDSLYTEEYEGFLESQIEGIMPAHLTAEVYFGGESWRQKDEKNKTWTATDGENLTWKQLDNLK